MPRIGHKKSRNGCSNCKQRKVKCDENRPCGACVRLQIDCSLTPTSIQNGPQLHISALDGHRDDASTISSKSTPPGAPSITPPPSVGADFPLGSATEDTYPWMTDLGLMNHFTSVTSATLPGANLHTWRDKVPAVAAGSPYLMHQILAVAAFHLACSGPLGSPSAQAHTQQQQRQEKLSSALQHQHHAIRGVQDEISHVTPANCDALFAASSLLFIGAFAASGPTLHSPLRQLEVDDILEVFTLIRGVSSVLASARENVRHGILKDFMKCNPYLGGNELLTLLQDNISRIQAGGLDQHDVNSEVKSIIGEAVLGFRNSIERASSMTPELNVAVSWPMILRDNFMALLVVQEPASLVVLAHYCTVIHAAGSQFWFMREWGCHLIAAILRSLPPNWHDEIQWPVSYVKPGLASQNEHLAMTSDG
ncbi:hypothetical protein HER10_EVM0007798 [Colletotrichum scovillei]|uniref:uncharacterized protein n=1 Tax=Colletotrichum scovillei TaxID=1209932 RepID=UPI0015C324AC|nr:uncharacterized protein HER10_EVM0007798 [Colletotrichum scovillei]KAF4784388.1 hypothetical protein HER10_EVM0007798 [Colletotrichum scovillei]